MLGIKVAEYIHGYRRKPHDPTEDKLFETLKEVADGTLTLMDTPEEELAKLPPPSPQIAKIVEQQIRDGLRIGRENQRIAAQKIVQAMPEVFQVTRATNGRRICTIDVIRHSCRRHHREMQMHGSHLIPKKGRRVPLPL